MLTSILLSLVCSIPAYAVEWPDISTPAHQVYDKSKDRAVIVALEDYEYLSPIRNASMNAQDWSSFFQQGLGIPSSQIILLQDNEASHSKIVSSVKRSARRLKNGGRLWIIYIGHGLTMFDDNSAAILPFETSLEPRKMYEDAIDMEDLSDAIGEADAQTVMIFDAAFNAMDRQGDPLSDTVPVQEGVVPSFESKSTVLSAVAPGENAGVLSENYRPAFSYLVLGALRGWSDLDQNGVVSFNEVVDYTDVVLGSQTPSIDGRLKRQKITDAVEEGPSLVKERRAITPVDPMSLVPAGMLDEGVSLENLLNELAQQREYEVQIQQEIDSQVADLRGAASLHWQKIRGFAEQRVDDPARVAVYAFLREYQSVIIEVQGKEFEVDIPEVQLARQLLTRLATPTIEGVEFTWVPADNFVMGNSEQASLEHPVRLTHSFYASTTEVTQQLYQFILNENPSSIQGNLFPVTNVSWFDAVRFTNALSSFEGLEECYVINGDAVTFPLGTECLGYRLPTEAEWEYAARADGNGGFAGGDRIGKLGWVNTNSGEEVHFVKQKVANGFGLYDMSGNVSEWVWDWYEPYNPTNMIDPVGPKEGVYRVQRGGSAMANIGSARIDARYPVQPSYVSPSQGFRIVRTVPDI